MTNSIQPHPENTSHTSTPRDIHHPFRRTRKSDTPASKGTTNTSESAPSSNRSSEVAHKSIPTLNIEAPPREKRLDRRKSFGGDTADKKIRHSVTGIRSSSSKLEINPLTRTISKHHLSSKSLVSLPPLPSLSSKLSSHEGQPQEQSPPSSSNKTSQSHTLSPPHSPQENSSKPTLTSPRPTSPSPRKQLIQMGLLTHLVKSLQLENSTLPNEKLVSVKKEVLIQISDDITKLNQDIQNRIHHFLDSNSQSYSSVCKTIQQNLFDFFNIILEFHASITKLQGEKLQELEILVEKIGLKFRNSTTKTRENSITISKLQENLTTIGIKPQAAEVLAEMIISYLVEDGKQMNVIRSAMEKSLFPLEIAELHNIFFALKCHIEERSKLMQTYELIIGNQWYMFENQANESGLLSLF
jgi:hypothetical protein